MSVPSHASDPAIGSALSVLNISPLSRGPSWSGSEELADDPEEFVRRVTEAIQVEAWAVDGNYGPVREQVWRRATHLVWLDYERPVIMARVISRTLLRAVLRTELWAGNRERWRQMLRPSHPIRWAWSTWRHRRAEIEQLITGGAFPHLVGLRLRRPAEATGVIDQLQNPSPPR